MNRFSWKSESERERERGADLLSLLLDRRGVKEHERSAFLSPDYDQHTHSPYLFSRMKDAISVVMGALQRGERIMIHGDYDADGVSGSSLLYLALYDIAERLNLDAHISVYLPDREKDGYGVAMHTVERFLEEGVEVLVTVDCGIANVDEFSRAHEGGMKVVVCDHHQLGTKLPEHAIIIHPLVPGEEYPNKTLCGTGVAFKLATALFDEARKLGADFVEGYEKWYLDFVAIATVTDVMPLVGENRVLQTYGLKVLNKTRRVGLRALMRQARVELGEITTTTIGFQIGPRINASGRIASAEIAFRALTARSEKEADEYAVSLERLNRERKAISDRAYREAVAMVHERLRVVDEGMGAGASGGENGSSYGVGAPLALVVVSETWNPGIVGLVAGKLVTEFGLPAFALTRVGKHYVGSGRTAGNLHLVEAMRSAGEIYLKSGGHPQACGLSLAPERVPEFIDAIERFAHTFFHGEAPLPTLQLDAHVPLSELSLRILEELSGMQPYGEGNPEPIFYDSSVELDTLDTVGKDHKHLRLIAKTGRGIVKGIGFHFGHLIDEIDQGRPVEIAYRPSVNHWNGRREVQFELVDIKQEL